MLSAWHEEDKKKEEEETETEEEREARKVRRRLTRVRAGRKVQVARVAAALEAIGSRNAVGRRRIEMKESATNNNL